MTEFEPKMVAIDYYDGATEGFARSILDGRDCYFVLVAWDAEQDYRLYAAVAIDSSKYGNILSLLGRTQEVNGGPLWIPQWEFLNQEDRHEADEFIRDCRERLLTDGFFLLTQQMAEVPSWKKEIRAELASKLAAALVRGIPDDLEAWRDEITAVR